MKVLVLHSGESYLVTALIDSGSEGNFVDENTARRLHLNLRELHDPPNLSAIDGGPIGKGRVTHCTEPITFNSATYILNVVPF